MKDLAISIFEILRETPISALGINHLFYFALPDENRYYEVGNKLAPLGPWKTFINDPKVMNLEIGELVRTDGYKGAYRIKIRPSDITLSTPYGLLIHINDHYNIDGENNNMLTVLKDIWGNSCERAAKVCDQIWEI